MSDFGKVTCPYCKEEKINKEKYFEENPQMIKFKVYNYECEVCGDSKKVDWIDAVIKPYTTYVGGYSGYQGYKVLNTLCKPCNYSVGSVVYALDTKQTYIKQTNSWVLVN